MIDLTKCGVIAGRCGVHRTYRRYSGVPSLVGAYHTHTRLPRLQQGFPVGSRAWSPGSRAAEYECRGSVPTVTYSVGRLLRTSLYRLPNSTTGTYLIKCNISVQSLTTKSKCKGYLQSMITIYEYKVLSSIYSILRVKVPYAPDSLLCTI